MYHLVIVSGPNRGSSFRLQEGENRIGRQNDSEIVLSSTRVSKHHCAILLRDDELFLRDESSTNGTFVNGALVKKVDLKVGDRIGVGDFVLEITSNRPNLPAVQGDLNSAGALALSQEAPASTAPELKAVHDEEEVMPDDLPGKLRFFFEGKIMPNFYGAMMKNEYRVIVGMLFAGVVAVSVMGSVLPMQDLAEKSIRREALLRARVLAREVADRALPSIANRTESQIDLSAIAEEDSVKLVTVVNPNLQIIAPQSRLNQLFASGQEAGFTSMMAKQFKDGRERGTGMILPDSIAIYVEPIKTADPRQIKSTVSAMAVVAIDFSSNLLQAGGLGVAYGTGIVVAGLAALLAYFIILRLSFKPYEVLNDDLDQILRGELPKVTQEFKIEETAALWGNINAAAQRIPKHSGSDGHTFSEAEEIVNWDHEVAPIRAVCESSGLGLIAFDPSLTVVGLNPRFEEMSGIHFDSIGRSLNEIARDQAFMSLIQDLQSRVETSPSRSVVDEFEFSGVLYEVSGIGVGPMTQTGISAVFRKKE